MKEAVSKLNKTEALLIVLSALFVLAAVFLFYHIGMDAQATHRDEWSNSYDIHAGVSGVEIDKHGACRVYSNSSSGPDTFFPLKSASEYTALRANYPSNITQGGCTSPPTSPPPPPPSGCSYPTNVCKEVCDAEGCSGCASCYSWQSCICVN